MKIQSQIKKIKNFKNLKQNWDGYGADPISDIVINRSIELFRTLSDFKKEKKQISIL